MSVRHKKWKQWGCFTAFDSGVLSSENMGQGRKISAGTSGAEPAIQIKSGATLWSRTLTGPSMNAAFCKMHFSSTLKDELQLYPW